MAETEKGEGIRWWEFYAVRYAMGTVLGAVIVHLLCETEPALRPLLLLGSPDANDANPALDASGLIVLAAYGLVYCYIASAPILVLHAVRSLLPTKKEFNVSRCEWYVLSGGLLMAGILAITAYLVSSSLVEAILCFLGAASLIQILLIQLLLVFRGLKQSDELFTFYRKLATRRAEPGASELTESYRHLREHGNSFFIVVLELILALVLVAIGRFAFAEFASERDASGALGLYIGTVFVWVVPAAFVWLIATRLERDFVEDATTKAG